MRGPYWTGAFTPTGGRALVTVPHEHSLLGDQVMLGDLQPDHGKIEHLPMLNPHDRRIHQTGPAPGSRCAARASGCGRGLRPASNVNPACPSAGPGPAPT